MQREVVQNVQGSLKKDVRKKRRTRASGVEPKMENNTKIAPLPPPKKKQDVDGTWTGSTMRCWKREREETKGRQIERKFFKCVIFVFFLFPGCCLWALCVTFVTTSVRIWTTRFLDSHDVYRNSDNRALQRDDGGTDVQPDVEERKPETFRTQTAETVKGFIRPVVD